MSTQRRVGRPPKKARAPVGSNTEEPRKRRLPIFDRRDRMAFPRDPRFYRVWVADHGGQLKDYLDSGFSFVTQRDVHGAVGEGGIEEGTQMDSRVSCNTGRAGTQDNVISYLLQMPMDEWEEIRAIHLEERRAPIKEIMREGEKWKRGEGNYGEGITIDEDHV